MNPILVATVARRLKRRQRICPQCKRKQLAPAGQEKISIRCASCNTTIPPLTKTTR